jgi:hypothetical protein
MSVNTPTALPTKPSQQGQGDGVWGGSFVLVAAWYQGATSGARGEFVSLVSWSVWGWC